ncbi:MAG TPA: DUF6468 domain-containing protein [Sphingomonadaceae bacterium]|nr:DUF6468 domain-containing protein [Sphingomonadaceae bacterium]
MTFATFMNLVVAILCVAVVLQSMRMTRNIQAIKSGDLGETVKSLDNATAQAREVLAKLKDVLTTDGAANVRTIASGETLRDELSVMVGIGNAVAERIMEAAAAAGERKEEAATAAQLPAKPARRKRPLAKTDRTAAPHLPTHARLQ